MDRQLCARRSQDKGHIGGSPAPARRASQEARRKARDSEGRHSVGAADIKGWFRAWRRRRRLNDAHRFVALFTSPSIHRIGN